jgi:hypothetical protein
VNQSAPTPNTQNTQVRDVRTLSYREGENIPGEESTWEVMAAVYKHTIGEFLRQGTISVAHLIEDKNQKDLETILIVKNVAQWGEFLAVDEDMKDCIIQDFFVISRLRLFGNQNLTGRDRAVGELLIRMMPEFLMSFIETYSKSTRDMYLFGILITRYQGFVAPYAKVLSDFSNTEAGITTTQPAHRPRDSHGTYTKRLNSR